MISNLEHKALEERIRMLEEELAQHRHEIAELTQEHGKYAFIFENAPLLIMIVDEHWRVEIINQSGLYTSERVEALNCFYHQDEDQRCGTRPACENCKVRILVKDSLVSGKSHQRVKVRIPMTDGLQEERFLLVSSMPIQRNGAMKALVFVEDITERQFAEEVLHVRRLQQRAIAEISQLALGNQDLQSLLERGVKLLQDTLKVELVNVLEFLPKDGSFILRAGRGWHDGQVGKAVVGAERTSQAGFTLLSNQPVIVVDLQKEKRFSGPALLREHGVVSGMSVIIGKVDKPYGVLGVHSTGHREFSLHDIDFMQKMADVFASAIERRRMEVVLNESEERYRLLFHQSPFGVVHVDSKGVVVDVNDNYLKILGIKREELIGLDLLSRVTDPMLISAIEDALNGKVGYYTGEYRSVVSGRNYACNILTQGIFNADGKFLGGLAIIEDIAEQKKLQDALRKSEFLLRQAQSVAGVGSWHLDITNNVMTCSDQTYEILGGDKETPLNMAYLLDLVHADDRDAVQSAWQAAMTGKPYDIEHRIVVGEEIHWVHEKAQVAFNDEGLPLEGVGTVHDITQRKQAEEKIIRAKEEWESTFDSVSDLIAILDTDFRIVRANKAMLEKLGGTSEAGFTCYHCVHNEEKAPSYCPNMKLLQDGKEHTAEVYEERLGGYYFVSVTPLHDSTGKLVGSVHTAHDINERKIAEQAIRESEEKYRALFESSRDAVVILDNQTIVECNRAALEMFGCDSTDKIFHKKLSEFSSEIQASGIDSITEEHNNLSKALANGSNFFEWIHRRYDGQDFPTEVMLSRFEIEGKTMLQALIRDITKRKSMENELKCLATTDSLTGADNRGYFLEKVTHEINRSHRYGSTFAFLMMDVDYFKRINDTYGHHVGDKVLKALVSRSIELLRKTDVFGRVGGEEFAAVLSETEENTALEIAERLRVELSKIRVESDLGAVEFTVSIGLAMFEQGEETVETIMKRSDIALYKAKESGRNRVVSG